MPEPQTFFIILFLAAWYGYNVCGLPGAGLLSGIVAIIPGSFLVAEFVAPYVPGTLYSSSSDVGPLGAIIGFIFCVIWLSLFQILFRSNNRAKSK